MPPREFTPPKYVEIHHYFFDKRSGEIVATETRWSIARGKGRIETKVQPELLESVALKIGKSKSALDVLIVKKPRQGVTATRVDVRRRKLIVERTPAKSGGEGEPLRLEGP